MALTRLERFGARLLRVVVAAFLGLFRFFAPRQRARGHGGRLPRITEPLLRETAAQLARKIRRKQVRR